MGLVLFLIFDMLVALSTMSFWTARIRKKAFDPSHMSLSVSRALALHIAAAIGVTTIIFLLNWFLAMLGLTSLLGVVVALGVLGGYAGTAWSAVLLVQRRMPVIAYLPLMVGLALNLGTALAA